MKKKLKENDLQIFQDVYSKKINFKKNKKKKANFTLNQKKLIISNSKSWQSLQNLGKIKAEIVSQSKDFAFARSLASEEEIFIPKKHMKTALLGDKVIINKLKNSDKGLSGAVEKVIEEKNHVYTGKIVCALNGLEVHCDSAIKYNIPLLENFSMGAKAGDKVKVIIFRLPENNQIYAEVIKIYGEASSAKICAEAIIDKNEIPYKFPNNVTMQANKIANLKITKKEKGSRLDLRNDLVFTIDGEDAKDLDDAISIKKLDEGWELGVHIADVSHYIPYNSEIDKEALQRGTSVYFPGKVIPMFPEAISNGVCSLNACEDKLAFSCIMKISKNGNIAECKFVKSIINSKVRGIYSEVNEILQEKAPNYILEKYKKVINCIKEAKQLSDILEKKSKKRGTLDLTSTESKFLLDKNGKCIDVKLRNQGISENIIENFMIAANSAAALYAKNLNLPFIYRVHENPEPKKIEALANFVSLLGLKNNKIRPGLKPKDIACLIQQAEKTPYEVVISRQILQTLAKARYETKPLGHFGLSLLDYCHFTSPIRRYPDVCVHRILSETINFLGASVNCNDLDNNNKIKNKLNKKYSKKFIEYAKNATNCEIRAMKAEREAEKYYMAEFMSGHIGEFFDGVISGISPKGVFVELENGISGFMDLSHYKEYKFEFDGIASYIDKSKNKKLAIGDKINVKLISVDISSAFIDFALTENI